MPRRPSKLLASIDLKDRNGDGLVDDAQGKTATFSILTQKGHTVRERSAAMMKEHLRRVGLDVDVAAVERGSMIEAWSQGDYDAICIRDRIGLVRSGAQPRILAELRRRSTSGTRARRRRPRRGKRRLTI